MRKLSKYELLAVKGGDSGPTPKKTEQEEEADFKESMSALSGQGGGPGIDEKKDDPAETAEPREPGL